MPSAVVVQNNLEGVRPHADLVDFVQRCSDEPLDDASQNDAWSLNPRGLTESIEFNAPQEFDYPAPSGVGLHRDAFFSAWRVSRRGWTGTEDIMKREKCHFLTVRRKSVVCRVQGQRQRVTERSSSISACPGRKLSSRRFSRPFSKGFFFCSLWQKRRSRKVR